MKIIIYLVPFSLCIFKVKLKFFMTRFDSLGKFILLILISQFNFGQNQYQPQKSPATKIVLDGILSSDEWENATPI